MEHIKYIPFLLTKHTKISQSGIVSVRSVILILGKWELIFASLEHQHSDMLSLKL